MPLLIPTAAHTARKQTHDPFLQDALKVWNALATFSAVIGKPGEHKQTLCRQKESFPPTSCGMWTRCFYMFAKCAGTCARSLPVADQPRGARVSKGLSASRGSTIHVSLIVSWLCLPCPALQTCPVCTFFSAMSRPVVDAAAYPSVYFPACRPVCLPACP